MPRKTVGQLFRRAGKSAFHKNIRIKDEKLCFYIQFVVRTHYEKVDNVDRIT